MLRAPPPQYGPGFWIASIERRQLDHAFQKTVFCVPNIYGNPNHQPIDITHRYWSLELRTSLTEAICVTETI